MMKFRGLVKRINGTCANGFIFTMQTSDDFHSKVCVPENVLAHPPPKGSSVIVEGEYFKSSTSWDIQAKDISLVLPARDEFVDLLAHHPMFGAINWRDAHRLWYKLKEKLPEALDSWDEAGWMSAQIPPLLVSRILCSWRSYSAYVDFLSYAKENDVPAPLRESIWEMYGVESKPSLQANPFIMTQFAPWSQIDSVLHNEHSGRGREAAAVIAVLEAGRRQGRCWLTVAQLTAGVVNLLCSPAAAEQAVQYALASSICEQIDLNSSFAISTRTLAHMYNRLVSRFQPETHLTPFAATALGANSFVIGSELELVNIIRELRYCVINLPHLAATEMVKFTMSDLVHISPVSLISSPPIKGRENAFTFADALSGRIDYSKQNINAVCLVYFAHACDLICLNKLIAAIPSTWSVCLFGDLGLCRGMAQHSIFENLHTRQNAVITLSPAIRLLEMIINRHNEQLSWIKRLDWTKRTSPEEIPTGSIDTLLPLARKAFLKAATLGSAIILTETMDFANRLNAQLRREAQDVRDFMKEDMSTVCISNGELAGVGDPIIYTGQDLGRTLLRGANGSLSRIFASPISIMQPNGTTKIFVAEASFDTSGKISLTQTDLQAITLGFAAPYYLPIFGRFDECICTVEEGNAEVGLMLLVASSISFHCHPILNSAANFDRQLA